MLNRDLSAYEPLTNRPDYREMTIEIKGDELVVTTQVYDRAASGSRERTIP